MEQQFPLTSRYAMSRCDIERFPMAGAPDHDGSSDVLALSGNCCSWKTKVANREHTRNHRRMVRTPARGRRGTLRGRERTHRIHIRRPPMMPRPSITNAALADRPDLGEGASVGLALPHDSATRHVQGTAFYIDDLPEPAGTVHVAPRLRHGRRLRPCRRPRARRHPLPRSRRGARLPRSAGGADRGRRARDERLQPRGRRRSDPRGRRDPLSRAGGVRGGRRDPGRGPPRRAPRPYRDRCPPPCRHRGSGPCRRGRDAAALRVPARGAGARHRHRPAPARRPRAHRRPGALLS